jgi:hypothetical protein
MSQHRRLSRSRSATDLPAGAKPAPSISPRKNALVALVAFFNLAKRGAKLHAKAQNNDLRRDFAVTSV